MKQYQQVMAVMEDNGGFATLGFLNQKVDVSQWKTKTPFASIRRIVQDDRLFFKIKPGLWALNKYREQVLDRFELEKSPQKDTEFSHSYFQGLLLEIGKIQGFQTFVPAQDKNRYFLDRKLQTVSTLENLYQFTYPEIIRRAKTIDVIWFNERRFPHSFFEVEHTTDIQNSLLKFNDLQDFYSKFYILSDSARKREFQQKINYSAFRSLKTRVNFIDYEHVSNLHSKTVALSKVGDL